MTSTELDDALLRIEQEMPELQFAHRDLFSYANAWAVRYDALLARTPMELRESVESRLQRIGIRWGVANGMRLTGQFPAIKQPA